RNAALPVAATKPERLPAAMAVAPKARKTGMRGSALRISCMPAARPVARPVLDGRRSLQTDFGGTRTTFAKRTALRQVQYRRRHARVGNHPLHDRTLLGDLRAQSSRTVYKRL